MDRIVTLGEVVRRIESADDPHALRFEVVYYDSLTRKSSPPAYLSNIIDANHCDSRTARMIAATSWGAWQLMGFNIYGACRYTRSIGTFLGSSADQNLCAGYYLDVIGFNANDDVDRIDLHRFAKLYNGPAYMRNNYVDRMKDARDRIKAAPFKLEA